MPSGRPLGGFGAVGCHFGQPFGGRLGFDSCCGLQLPSPGAETLNTAREIWYLAMLAVLEKLLGARY
jgi:hypothetical protein